MSNPATVIAAGGVVWRDGRDGRQILLVHRPRYDDWSLPKGKLTPNEHILSAARREIEEETGQLVLLGPPLGIQRYDVRKNGNTVPKLVHYWSAQLTGPEREFVPSDEVDRCEWLPLDKARRRLSYPRDVEILDALDDVTPVVSTLVLLRHAEAVKRKDWEDKDSKRPLSGFGLATADRLVDVLAAVGVDRILSSDADRCVSTISPYAEATGRKIHLHPEISQRGYDADPSDLQGFTESVWKPGRVTVVCTHRPVLPAVSKELGVKAGKFSPGAFVIAYHLEDGRQVHERFNAP